MRRLLKKAQNEVRLPELFQIEGDTINLVEDIYSFFEEALMETVRNVSNDEKGEVLILHFVLDRASLEDYTGHAVDDATCKVIVKGFDKPEFISTMKDKYEDYVSEQGHDMKVLDICFEFGDGVFHAIVTCSR